MADQETVRRLSLALPQVVENDDRFAFSVLVNGTLKGICWVWNERVVPGEPKVPNPDVIGVRVAGEIAKNELIAAVPETYFTEPHYNGFPAILVRLSAIEEGELRELLTDAWRIQAPKTLVKSSGL
jgi:hypothetical protein